MPFLKKFSLFPIFSFKFSTSRVFYPRKAITFIKDRYEITNRPLRVMHNSLKIVTIFQCFLLSGSTYYIFSNYQHYKRPSKLTYLLISLGISIFSLIFFIRHFKKTKNLIFKIELFSDGKHINITKMTRFLNFKEDKIPINTIKQAISDDSNKKYYEIGKPFMIGSELYLLMKGIKKEIDIDQNDILEAVLRGEEIFVGQAEEDDFHKF